MCDLLLMHCMLMILTQSFLITCPGDEDKPEVDEEDAEYVVPGSLTT